MNEPPYPADGDATQPADAPVPTAGQVLARTLPAAVVLSAGLPVLTYWGLDGNGDERGGWLPFAPALLMAVVLLVQHLVQAPRPRLGQLADRKALRRWLAFTSDSGRLPEDPRTRIAAGALACGQVEAAVLMVAAVMGMIATPVVRSTSWSAVTALLVALIAVIPAVRTRRGWRYLQALDAHARSG